VKVSVDRLIAGELDFEGALDLLRLDSRVLDLDFGGLAVFSGSWAWVEADVDVFFLDGYLADFDRFLRLHLEF
jgi:hypothetical protein